MSTEKSHEVYTMRQGSITCHVAAFFFIEILSSHAEHASNMLDANGMHSEHTLRINTALCFQFELIGLQTPPSHEVIEIFYCRFLLSVVHLMCFSSFIYICSTERTTSRSKQSNLNYSHPI